MEGAAYLAKTVAQHEERLTHHEQQIRRIESKLDDLGTRVNKIDLVAASVDNLSKDMAKLQDTVNKVLYGVASVITAIIIDVAVRLVVR